MSTYYDGYIIHAGDNGHKLALRTKEILKEEYDFSCFVAPEDIPDGVSNPHHYMNYTLVQSPTVLILFDEEASKSDNVMGELELVKDYRRRKHIVLIIEKKFKDWKIKAPQWLIPYQRPLVKWDARNIEQSAQEILKAFQTGNATFYKSPYRVEDNASGRYYYEFFEAAKEVSLIARIDEETLNRIHEKLNHNLLRRTMKTGSSRISADVWLTELIKVLEEMINHELAEIFNHFNEIFKENALVALVACVWIKLYEVGYYPSRD